MVARVCHARAEIGYAPSLGPWMGWYLRDHPNAAAASQGLERADALILVAPLEDVPEAPGGYAGQRIRLSDTWPQQALSTRERVRWFLYRTPVGSVQATEIGLWVKLPTE